MKSLAYYLYRLKYNYPQFFGHKPVHLDLEIAGACNMVCPFCYRQDKDYEGPKAEFMDYIDACKIMQDAYDAGMRSIKFNWRGEPTLHKDFSSIVKKAKDIGFLDRMINTNGSNLIDKETLDNLTEVRFSLDTMDYDDFVKMRPPFNLADVFSEIYFAIDEHNPKKTNIIIQRRTIENLELDDKFWYDVEGAYYSNDHNNKLKHVKFISKPVQPRVSGGYLGSYHSQWKAGLIKRQYCKQPSQRLVVGVDGWVHYCCLNYNNNQCLAHGGFSGVEIPFNGIINSKGRNLFIDDLRKEFFDCQECEKCTSYTAYKGK